MNEIYTLPDLIIPDLDEIDNPKDWHCGNESVVDPDTRPDSPYRHVPAYIMEKRVERARDAQLSSDPVATTDWRKAAIEAAKTPKDWDASSSTLKLPPKDWSKLGR